MDATTILTLTEDEPAFKALDRPHKEVHARGKSALQALNAGNIDTALAEVAKSGEASKEVLRLLEDVKWAYRKALKL